MNGGFSRPVVVVLTVIFALTVPVALALFGLNFLDIWYPTFNPITERFDTTAVLRISAVLAALIVALSGLLWAHHRQEASYTTPLEFFFGVCFGFFLFILILSGAGALFGG